MSERFEMRVTREWLDRVDEARGFEPRASFVKRTLESALGSGPQAKVARATEPTESRPAPTRAPVRPSDAEEHLASMRAEADDTEAHLEAHRELARARTPMPDDDEPFDPEPRPKVPDIPGLRPASSYVKPFNPVPKGGKG